MEKKSFLKRFVYPQVPIILIMAVSFLVYHFSPGIKNYVIFQALSTISGILILLTLWFGAIYIYMVSYFRGASFTERILACFIPAFLWATKESIIIASVYTVPEGIYFYLSIVNQWLVSTIIAEIGLSHILCRRKLKKQGEEIKGTAIPAILAMVVGVGNSLFILLWNVGVQHFYIFIAGYKAFFF